MIILLLPEKVRQKSDAKKIATRIFIDHSRLNFDCVVEETSSLAEKPELHRVVLMDTFCTDYGHHTVNIRSMEKMLFVHGNRSRRLLSSRESGIRPNKTFIVIRCINVAANVEDKFFSGRIWFRRCKVGFRYRKIEANEETIGVRTWYHCHQIKRFIIKY